MALHAGTFRNASSATREARTFGRSSAAQHLQEEAGLGRDSHPQPALLIRKQPAAPGRGPHPDTEEKTQQNREEEQRADGRRAPHAGPGGSAALRGQRRGRSAGAGRGRRLTWRGAPRDACSVSAAGAASPLRATAPPCSRSGRSGQGSGAPALAPAAPAPPKAPAAAGSASALATSPSFGRAAAGPAAYPAPRATRGPTWSAP